MALAGRSQGRWSGREGRELKGAKMLHLFFFVMTYLTDYRAVAEVAHSGFALGLVNAALICVVCPCVVVRRWPGRARQR